MAKNITIYQIAKESGVSVSTVSRYLTGNANVALPKRERIQEVIDKYDYQPNSMARSLSNKSTRTLGVVLPDITHPHFNHIFMGAEAQALTKGYTLLLGCTMNDRTHHITNLESMYLQILQQKQVDGMIVIGGMVNEADPIPEHKALLDKISAQIPVVTVNDALMERNTYQVSIDDPQGTTALINYLISLRHQEIAYLGGDEDIQPTMLRLNSIKSALEAHGIQFNEEYFIPGGFDVDSGKACMTKLLALPQLPTAVICLNDLVAIGAMATAKKAGLRIPEDISFAGSDNMPMSEYITPALTTVDLRATDIGALAIDVLVSVIEGKDVDKHNMLGGRLVIRESCRMNAD